MRFGQNRQKEPINVVMAAAVLPSNRWEELWDKLRQFAVKAGKEIIEKVLVLYYCLQDPDTPPQAKTVIAAALSYFVLPVDVIPDLVPVVGFTDDLHVLMGALAIVIAHIKPKHWEQARDKMKEWFMICGCSPHRESAGK